ncbi:MAG TPA: hypothetical protein VFQ53_00795 [Kofleriaceae bacterium]|nr:hypothetical protein [Kofleriaceae bacterium]
MSLVIDLGLERYEPLQAVRILEALVRGKQTTCVRDVFGSRVLEVSATAGNPASRWLPDKLARPILRDLKQLADRGRSYATFSWDETEAYGIEVQELAVVRDGDGRFDIIEVDGRMIRVLDLDKSARSFRGTRGNVGTAAKLHAVAKQHRLIVHSA